MTNVKELAKHIEAVCKLCKLIFSPERIEKLDLSHLITEGWIASVISKFSLNAVFHKVVVVIVPTIIISLILRNRDHTTLAQVYTVARVF